MLRYKQNEYKVSIMSNLQPTVVQKLISKRWTNMQEASG